MHGTLAFASKRAPLIYRVAKNLERQRVRGATRLLRVLRRFGCLNQPVDFRLDQFLHIRVPITRNEYDQADINTYEADLLDALASEVTKLPAPVTLIDVGADIGLFTLRMLARFPSFSSIFAFEPNSEGFPWLEFNLSRLPSSIERRAYQAAIADFRGRGRLVMPEPGFSPGIVANHTQEFIEPSPEGPVEVMMLDSLTLPSNGSLVMKIDVEGGELAAIRGAMRTISQSRTVIVALEAHPSVVRRTGVDPVHCLRLLSSFRPFHYYCSEGGITLNTGAAVFDQIAPNQVYNIVARSD
ncbi:MAG: hypothetical protein PGMFKBFP_03034 [Anaerolineales bacterium]|nr:hypothetical protein [Anaerolineales bacterium]